MFRRARRARPTHRDAGRRDRTIAGSEAATTRWPPAGDVEAVFLDSGWVRTPWQARIAVTATGQSVIPVMLNKDQSGRPFSAHKASTSPASAAGSSSESTARSCPRAAASWSAAFMLMPITWPLGASRSWPWQASSTSHASSSCRLAKAARGRDRAARWLRIHLVRSAASSRQARQYSGPSPGWKCQRQRARAVFCGVQQHLAKRYSWKNRSSPGRVPLLQRCFRASVARVRLPARHRPSS